MKNANPMPMSKNNESEDYNGGKMSNLMFFVNAGVCTLRTGG
jgi:hypothetical protein